MKNYYSRLCSYLGSQESENIINVPCDSLNSILLRIYSSIL